MNRKRIQCSCIRPVTARYGIVIGFEVGRIRASTDSAKIASDPGETVYDSRAGRIESHPALNGQVLIRCRLRKDRVRSKIDLAEIGSDPEEPA
jgi:hypothetical protein